MAKKKLQAKKNLRNLKQNKRKRNNIFSRLRNIYGDWRVVSKKMGVNTRNLFGIRRGYEIKFNKKVKRYMSSDNIIKVNELLNICFEDIQKYVTHIKIGFSGFRARVKLPIVVDLKHDPKTLQRAIADHVFISKHIKEIEFTGLPRNITIDNRVVSVNIIFGIDKLEELRLRGLSPKLNETDDCYSIEFRNPGTAEIIQKIVPKFVKFDEIFAKEFGKWVGDRCGGPNKIGVCNKNWIFVDSFKKFVYNILKQPKKNIITSLNCNQLYKPPISFINKVDFVNYTNQFGMYAFRVDVSNKFVRDYIFNVVESNIFEILFNSKKEVIYAFYAGLFEAEGSVIINSKNISLSSFGYNLKNGFINDDILSLLKRVVKHKFILSSVGFNCRISRRVSRTDKSYTIKYDLILLSSKSTREHEFKYLKRTIIPYIEHKDKLNKINIVFGD